jgi:diacylglycerol O-acyltransferase / wax synthase
MERMTGIDPMFIYSDTPETPMEIAYACIFDPATAEGGYTFERVVDRLEERIPSLPPFRRRLMPVPLGLDHPRWVDDPDFDLANHLHRTALPAPGGEAEFAGLVAQVMGRPLTPGQPPWEMHVIEGLAGGKVGLVAKVHHAVVDGVAGAQMLAQLLDLTPQGRAVTEPCPPWLPADLPSQAELMTDALPSFVQSPVRVLRAALELGNTAVRLARCVVADHRIGPLSIPLGAPDTFETPVRAQRAVAFAELDMALVRVLRERFDSTINDVVLAVCSGALRAHLAAHHQDVESPLVAVVPVSVRVDEGAAVGNQLSAMFVPLANDRKTPLERLRTVSAASASCKGQERAVGYGPMATLVADAIPPALARPAIQLGVRSGVLRKLRAGNLMVSNVPGPTFPLYFAGMQLRGVYPLGPVVDGVALNVTVQSYRDSLFVGINACAVAVPDPPGLARAMVEELSLLSRMAIGAGERRSGSAARQRRAAEGHVPPARATGRPVGVAAAPPTTPSP